MPRSSLLSFSVTFDGVEYAVEGRYHPSYPGSPNPESGCGPEGAEFESVSIEPEPPTDATGFWTTAFEDAVYAAADEVYRDGFYEDDR